MAQRFQSDVIGTLTQGLGTITLSASRLTIGGQQYKTSTLSLVLSGLIANTMYSLYAVQSAGVVSLVASANVNSIGPAGQTSWKLVGAFVTNNASTFTQFLSIEGLVTLKTWITSSQVTINNNVTGYMPLDGGQDTFGLIRAAAGAYNSAAGTFATTQPRLINPIPGANVTLQGELAWQTANANFANTWTITFRKNGASPIAHGANGWGANSGGTLNFMRSRGTAEYDNCVAGDYFEFLGTNDLANLLTSIAHVEVYINATRQIKDM